MDNDHQLDRIFNELSSIQAQLRSVAASTAHIAADIGQRVTAVEVGLESMIDRANIRSALVDGEFRELARSQGVTEANVSELKSMVDQAKGAGKVWRAIGATVATLGAALEAWHITRH